MKTMSNQIEKQKEKNADNSKATKRVNVYINPAPVYCK